MSARRLALLALVLVALSVPSSAWSGTPPSWTLDLTVSRWVAPSRFASRVIAQSAGNKVRIGIPVTLRLDRRTRCNHETAGGLVRIRCAGLRPLVDVGGVTVRTSGQFETGRLGAIGFLAREVLVTALVD